MSVFSTVLNEVLESNPSADPTDLAEDVISRLSDSDLKDVIKILMRPYIVQRLGGIRKYSATPPEFIPATPVGLSYNGGGTAVATKPKSAKVAGIKAWWEARLQDRFLGATSWVTLAEATAEDLLAAANQRRTLALSNIANAEEYEKFAKIMEEKGVSKFGALDKTSLEEAFTK